MPHNENESLTKNYLARIYKAIIISFMVFLILFAWFWKCCCECKKEQEAPVVVTSATHTAPGGYPVTQLPPPGYPAGNAYVTSPSYPTQSSGNVTVQMPMPMPHQNQQQMPMPMPGVHTVGYPLYPDAGAASRNPPPYDMAMANPGPSVMPAGYEKQAPYNPHFGQ